MDSPNSEKETKRKRLRRKEAAAARIAAITKSEKCSYCGRRKRDGSGTHFMSVLSSLKMKISRSPDDGCQCTLAKCIEGVDQELPFTVRDAVPELIQKWFNSNEETFMVDMMDKQEAHQAGHKQENNNAYYTASDSELYGRSSEPVVELDLYSLPPYYGEQWSWKDCALSSEESSVHEGEDVRQKMQRLGHFSTPSPVKSEQNKRVTWDLECPRLATGKFREDLGGGMPSQATTSCSGRTERVHHQLYQSQPETLNGLLDDYNTRETRIEEGMKEFKRMQNLFEMTYQKCLEEGIAKVTY